MPEPVDQADLGAGGAHGGARPSVFVVGLPRSLTSLVYLRASRSLGLRRPRWTGAGEILNLDRYATYAGPGHDESHKFTHPEVDPDDRIASVTAFLDDVVQPRGVAYKDVVQPFATAAWLADHPVATIVLERPLADVAFAVLTSRWYYPATASWLAEDRETAVLEGLVRAETALASVAGPRLAFDDLIADERPLTDALTRLAPGEPVAVEPYRDAVFEHESRRQLARRVIPPYRALADKIESVRAIVARGGPAPVARPLIRFLNPAAAESVRRRVCELLPRAATVGVVDREVTELQHLEGRRTLALPPPGAALGAAFDAAVGQGVDHLLLIGPEDLDDGESADADRVRRRLAGATVLHEDGWSRLYALARP